MQFCQRVIRRSFATSKSINLPNPLKPNGTHFHSIPNLLVIIATLVPKRLGVRVSMGGDC